MMKRHSNSSALICFTNGVKLRSGSNIVSAIL